MLTTSALSPLIQAVRDRYVSLSAANRVHLTAAPAGTPEPYAVIASDTENESVLVADRDGEPHELTVTVNHWGAHYADALALYGAFLASVSAAPLAIAGFAAMAVRLDGTFRLADPEAKMVGVSARYRLTLQPT